MVQRVRDEGDYRERPSKRGSRPRTKQRPQHAQAISGLVIAVDRGRYTLLVEGRTVIAMKARELSRTRIVCGDRVDVVGNSSGDEGTLARIVRISKRTSVLRRTADDTDPYERIIVANADQLVIVTALAQPEPRTGMIDRCVVAAYDAGMEALLCLTKADLADPGPLRDLYEPLGVRVIVTRRIPVATDEEDAERARDDANGPDMGPGTWTIGPLDELRAALAGKMSVFVGHSGVGKSTLVNALIPEAGRATGRVNDVTGRGRHTSTSTVMLALGWDEGQGVEQPGQEPGERPGNEPAELGREPAVTDDTREGWIIDTPGVRSFGLAHVEVSHLLRAFEDLDEVAEDCPRGCTHLDDAPDCALDEWIEHGGQGPDDPQRAARAARVASFRRLLAARTPSSPAR